MRKYFKWVALLLVLVMAIGLVGCGTAKKEDIKAAANKDDKFLRIGTASLGGNYFPMGAAIGALIGQKVPGYKATAQATGGSSFNMTALEKKELELAISQGTAVAAAVKAKKTPHVRTIANYNATPQHILVRKSANINSIQDLKGKKLEMIAAGDGVEVSSKKVLAALGIKWEEIKPEYSGNRVQAASRLKTGQVDAIIDGTGIGSAWLVDVIGDGSKFKLITLTDDEITKIAKQNFEFSRVTIPAKSYKGQDAAITTVGNWTVIVTRADLSEKLVYDITKAVLENQKFLKERHAYFTDLKATNMQNAIIAPLHPGAAKYYKEKGIIK